MGRNGGREGGGRERWDGEEWMVEKGRGGNAGRKRGDVKG